MRCLLSLLDVIESINLAAGQVLGGQGLGGQGQSQAGSS